MYARRAFLFALFSTVPLAIYAEATAAPPPYSLIANPANPLTSVGRKFVADAFLKKTTRWEWGEVIRPVDQTGDSPVRRKFSEEVLKRSVAAVRSYWQQIIFAGRDVPPPELASDDDVVRYVLKYPGAIGYVAGGTDLGGAKIVSVE